mmetsp:Transcript_85984/g.240385  ORF Transcript_85984/g.240385 Transcript_85984/m.240385 type:complete len:324 (+) Transcript_85984:680-1651(+)
MSFEPDCVAPLPPLTTLDGGVGGGRGVSSSASSAPAKAAARPFEGALAEGGSTWGRERLGGIAGGRGRSASVSSLQSAPPPLVPGGRRTGPDGADVGLAFGPGFAFGLIGSSSSTSMLLSLALAFTPALVPPLPSLLLSSLAPPLAPALPAGPPVNLLSRTLPPHTRPPFLPSPFATVLELATSLPLVSASPSPISSSCSSTAPRCTLPAPLPCFEAVPPLAVPFVPLLSPASVPFALVLEPALTPLLALALDESATVLGLLLPPLWAPPFPPSLLALSSTSASSGSSWGSGASSSAGSSSPSGGIAPCSSYGRRQVVSPVPA